MKHQLSIACIGILVAVFANCSEEKLTAVSETPPYKHELSVATETPDAPTRTPLPRNVREDADGNLIKSDGWPIQEIVPKETERSTAKGKTKKGKTVIYNTLTIKPQNRPEAVAIPPHHSPSLEWRVMEVAELSGRDGRIFCYEYRSVPYPRNSNANGMASVTRYRLCDYDGNGKFEFHGWGYAKLIIPDWVK